VYPLNQHFGLSTILGKLQFQQLDHCLIMMLGGNRIHLSLLRMYNMLLLDQHSLEQD